MAQTTQIVPKFSFPYVETIINDYTVLSDTADTSASDTSIRMAFAVMSGKGIDNVWVKKSSRKSAVKTFGESNFKKFGQPLMQALHVLDQPNSKVWMMRVMPENATYSNAIVSAYYKADTADKIADAHLRKFRIKLTRKSFKDIKTSGDLAEAFKKLDGVAISSNGSEIYKDAEGYTQVPLMAVRYSGRGTCGDLFSMRISKPTTYEKEYGITMYNFEVLNSEAGLEQDANYVGGIVSSPKYGSETATFINDILDETEAGVAPIMVQINEENVEVIYDEYIKFCKQLRLDLEAEYEEKVVEYDIPEEMLNGTAPVSDEYKAKVATLRQIENLIDATADEALPELDTFDIIFGKKVASNTSLPAIYYPAFLSADVDITADDYVADNYTSTTNLVDFTSAKGLILENGGDGYFGNPRTMIIDGESVKYTVEDEVTACYKKAYTGEFDPRILSSRRIDLSVIWDANYPFEIKEILADLALARNDCRIHLDTNIIESLSGANLTTLIEKYSVFKDPLISKDIHNYCMKEESTNKKCRVTISYFLAAEYVNHITNYGFHIPFVKEYCQLSGHIKDSLLPVVEEYQTDLKEALYDARLNYFECMSENVFQRAVQNTAQVINSDLLEESNVRILYTLKHEVEADVQGELYNFADEATRQSFIEYEKAKYAPWIGTIIQSFNISFSSTQYEFERSILHAYIEIVFRGLNKKAIVEIDINKRTYTAQVDTEL